MARISLRVAIAGRAVGTLWQDEALERYAQGGSKRVGRIMERIGLDAVGCKELMANLAQRVPAAMEQVFEDESALPGMDELRAHLLGPVSDNCARTLGLL